MPSLSITAPVKVDGSAVTQPTSQGASTNSSVQQFALVSNINTTILPANSNRKGAIIFAPSSTLYIKLGAGASTISFTYKVTSNNQSVPIDPTWTGQIDVVSSNSQTINVTELT